MAEYCIVACCMGIPHPAEERPDIEHDLKQLSVNE
jgi:hypothetical protein